MKNKVEKTNVVLLTIDALRYDHLGIYGYERQTDKALEPYLNHIAIFKNAYTYSMATTRSFAAIFSSISPDLCITKYPFFESYKKAWLPTFSRTIAEKFQEAGYYTAAHTCWVNYLTDKQGFGRGFKDFYGFLRQDRIKDKNKINKLTGVQEIQNSVFHPTGQNIVIALFDSGIDDSHIGFSENLIVERIDLTQETDKDLCGHGTLMAGLIAGEITEDETSG